jgi:hypothetical protein
VLATRWTSLPWSPRSGVQAEAVKFLFRLRQRCGMPIDESRMLLGASYLSKRSFSVFFGVEFLHIAVAVGCLGHTSQVLVEASC